MTGAGAARRPRRTARRLSLLAVVSLAALAWAVVEASATTVITVTPTCPHSQGCSFSPKGYSSGVGENPILTVPSDAESFQFHNVTAIEKGPDGRPLFRSPIVGPGGTVAVDGTQYLTPGVYPFICTIHADQLKPMTGRLVVTDNGAEPLPRPTIDVTLPAQSIGRIRSRHEVTVTVETAQPAEDVLVTIEGKGRRLGRIRGLSLEAGVPRTVQVGLNGAGRAAFEGVESAVVSARGSVLFGTPGTARRKFSNQRLGDRAYRTATVKVDIRHFAYHPHTLDIARGTTVVFVNHDSAPHDAKRAHSFSTGLIRSGHAAAQRFDHRGVYRYYCSLHPSMHGKIVVH